MSSDVYFNIFLEPKLAVLYNRNINKPNILGLRRTFCIHYCISNM